MKPDALTAAFRDVYEDNVGQMDLDSWEEMGRKVADAYNDASVVVPCPRCGGEGYDNVFMGPDGVPRHCGADVSA